MNSCTTFAQVYLLVNGAPLSSKHSGETSLGLTSGLLLKGGGPRFGFLFLGRPARDSRNFAAKLSLGRAQGSSARTAPSGPEGDGCTLVSAKWSVLPGEGLKNGCVCFAGGGGGVAGVSRAPGEGRTILQVPLGSWFPVMPKRGGCCRRAVRRKQARGRGRASKGAAGVGW